MDIFTWYGKDAWLNQHIFKVVFDKIEINKNFFIYLIQNILEDMRKQVHGATMKHITKEKFDNILVPLPPLATQKRIADILDTADALRRKDQELLTKYDQLAQAIFIDMFGDPVKNEKGKALNELIKVNPTKSEINVQDELLVSFIPMNKVGENGEFNNEEIRNFSEVKSGFTYFREGDVLFAKITPCMENGKGAIARNLKNGIGFGSTEFHVFRPNEILNSEFLYHLTKLNNFRVFAEANMTGSAGQKRVPTDFFNKIKIDVSKLKNQEKFATAMAKLNEQKQQTIIQINNSTSLFSSLIQQAFNGTLVS